MFFYGYRSSLDSCILLWLHVFVGLVCSLMATDLRGCALRWLQIFVGSVRSLMATDLEVTSPWHTVPGVFSSGSPLFPASPATPYCVCECRPPVNYLCSAGQDGSINPTPHSYLPFSTLHIPCVPPSHSIWFISRACYPTVQYVISHACHQTIQYSF